MPGVAGVGISFGVDRIYDVMEELNAFPGSLNISTRLMFINNGESSTDATLTLMNNLRMKGVSCELYHENSKIDKQYKYAEKKGITLFATINNLEKNVKLKNIISGEQKVVSFDALTSHLEQSQ